jgi:rod shape determining protein RodA
VENKNEAAQGFADFCHKLSLRFSTRRVNFGEFLDTGFISESQTDFIFTVIGEKYGFIGCCAVVLLIFIITVKCFLIAARAKDGQGRIIASGMGAWIGLQSFLNIGVATGLLPNTGIPLPFVSYGLTSLVCLYAGIGFTLNVRMQQ